MCKVCFLVCADTTSLISSAKMFHYRLMRYASAHHKKSLLMKKMKFINQSLHGSYRFSFNRNHETDLCRSSWIKICSIKKRWMNVGSSHRLYATNSNLTVPAVWLKYPIQVTYFCLQAKRKCYISTHWSFSEYQPLLCLDITWMREFRNDFKLPATLAYSLESCIECIEILPHCILLLTFFAVYSFFFVIDSTSTHQFNL